MSEGEVFVEMCCSRCDRISWDSMVGSYGMNCTKKGIRGAILPCDSLGRRMETDGEGYLKMFDKDGNDITSVVQNAEDQRLGSDE